MKKAVIAIPVYKQKPNPDEINSFVQCLKILHKHDIYIVTYKELNTQLYNDIGYIYSVNIQYKYFDKNYFKNIKGYNNLCLNKDFYTAFIEYEYMLIYQLDAWVFKDDLMKWCNKGYDYIGAPWFEDFGSYEKGKKLWRVGNGGFSLRNIKYFCKVLSWKWPVIKPKIKNLFNVHFLLFYLGRHNTIKYYKKNYNFNEDLFFSQFLSNSWCPPNIPKCKEALNFSFERSPSYLFKIANNKLPFGCHAYLKYEYDTFWKNYIN